MKYHCTRQHHTQNSGAACLATVAKQYGSLATVASVRRAVGLERKAPNSYGMVQAAHKLGFRANAVKGNPESFFSGFRLPAVAHVTTEDDRLHYIVIHKITDREILIADPAKGLRTLTPEEFFEIWTGILILMTPSEIFMEKALAESLFDRICDLLLPSRSLIPEI